MRYWPLALLVVLLSRASASDPEMTFTGKPFPPEGSAEDRELLAAMLRAQSSVLNERALAIKTTQRLADDRLDERLAAVAADRPGEAARVGDLRTRLRLAWDEDAAIVSTRWPVDPRLGCRSQGVQLEVLMGSSSARLAPARQQAKACLDAQLVPLRRLQKANRTLQAVLSEVDAALTSAPPRSAPERPAARRE